MKKNLSNDRYGGENLYLNVNIAHLKGQELSRAAQAFLDILMKYMPQKGPEENIRVIMAQMLENWKCPPFKSRAEG